MHDSLDQPLDRKREAAGDKTHQSGEVAEQKFPRAREAHFDCSTVEQSAAPARVDDEYDPDRQVAEDINVIGQRFRRWDRLEKISARSHEACYATLGEIFARSGPTEEDEQLKDRLVQEVIQRLGFSMSGRFDAFDATAAELHLALLFGVSSTRGSKSNWKNAIQAAEKAMSNGLIKERTAGAFIEWFAQRGFKGARAYLNGTPEQRRANKLAEIESLSGDVISLPKGDVDPEQLQPGLALLLVRIPDSQPDGGSPQVELLGLINDKDVVATASGRLAGQIDRHNMAIAAKGPPDADPALLIPKSLRPQFDGRTHFDHVDERNEYYRERKAERALDRKRYGPARRQPWEQKKRPRPGESRVERLGDAAVVASAAEDGTSRTGPDGPVADTAEPAPSLVAPPLDVSPAVEEAFDPADHEPQQDDDYDDEYWNAWFEKELAKREHL